MITQQRWALAAILGSGILATTNACSSAQHPEARSVDSQRATNPPASLRVPDGQRLLLHANARGFQIYVCSRVPGDTATKFAWTLKSPSAELFDESGAKIGTHGAGPTWHCDDGSEVVGERVASEPSPTANAIPWLLLRAKSTSGSGKLSRVAFIQRLETRGGVASSEGADAAHEGQESRVAYEAVYDFYGPER